MLRSVPFTAIDYLVASGQHPTKTAAQQAILPLLCIEQETLADWRKQQNRERRSDFNIALALSRRAGRDVRERRMLWPRQPSVKYYALYHDDLNGLPSVKKAAALLRAMGAIRQHSDADHGVDNPECQTSSGTAPFAS